MALWRYVIALIAACWFFCAPGAAAEWPQWRGPERDGVIPKELVPSKWPNRLERRWSVEVGTGHSSPIVSDGRVCLLARQGGEEVVACFAVTDGRRLWEDRYPAAYEVIPIAALGIEFISRQEALDTSTPMGKAMFTIIAAMAELLGPGLVCLSCTRRPPSCSRRTRSSP